MQQQKKVLPWTFSSFSNCPTSNVTVLLISLGSCTVNESCCNVHKVANNFHCHPVYTKSELKKEGKWLRKRKMCLRARQKNRRTAWPLLQSSQPRLSHQKKQNRRRKKWQRLQKAKNRAKKKKVKKKKLKR